MALPLYEGDDLQRGTYRKNSDHLVQATQMIVQKKKKLRKLGVLTSDLWAIKICIFSSSMTNVVVHFEYLKISMENDSGRIS